MCYLSLSTDALLPLRAGICEHTNDYVYHRVASSPGPLVHGEKESPSGCGGIGEGEGGRREGGWEEGGREGGREEGGWEEGREKEGGREAGRKEGERESPSECGGKEEGKEIGSKKEKKEDWE